MLPQLDWAKTKKYPVLVMNPNYNTDPDTKEPIPQSHTMMAHAFNVWTKYVLNSGFKQIHIIAYEAGGYILNYLQHFYKDRFYSQIGKIAITDSHDLTWEDVNDPELKFMMDNAIHYIPSMDDLGEVELGQGKMGRDVADKYEYTPSATGDDHLCLHVSAGHAVSAYTTGFAWKIIKDQFSMPVKPY